MEEQFNINPFLFSSHVSCFLSAGYASNRGALLHHKKGHGDEG
jgi:hypothetical protein